MNSIMLYIFSLLVLVIVFVFIGLPTALIFVIAKIFFHFANFLMLNVSYLIERIDFWVTSLRYRK